MNNLDNKIKEKLQNDKLISKNAENIFNNYLKEEIKMNEENMSKNNQKIKKYNYMKKFLSIAACLFVVLCGIIYVLLHIK